MIKMFLPKKKQSIQIIKQTKQNEEIFHVVDDVGNVTGKCSK